MTGEYDLEANIQSGTNHIGAKCAASLLNTNVWKTLLGKNKLASNKDVYVAGSPTLPLFATVWNSKYGEDKVEDGITIDYTETNKNGYTINGNLQFHELENCSSGESFLGDFPDITLASPGGDSMGNTLIHVDYYRIGGIVYNYVSGFRPIISLPSNVKLEFVYSNEYSTEPELFYKLK